MTRRSVFAFLGGRDRGRRQLPAALRPAAPSPRPQRSHSPEIIPKPLRRPDLGRLGTSWDAE